MTRTCIRQEPGYCMLRWIPSNEDNSFQISRPTGNTMAQVGKFSCDGDILLIPGATNMGSLDCAVNIDIAGTPTAFFVEQIGK